VQGAGSTALRPFQVAATRVAQPFRDAYDYVDSLRNAKAENKRLKKQNAALRASALIAAAQLVKYPDYAKLLHFEQSRIFPGGYRHINANVISSPGGPFAHTLIIDEGSA
jgi:cell shape-determining protein MreC